MKKAGKFIRRIWNNLYFLTFLAGFLIATLFYLKMESSYESELFENIVQNIEENKPGPIPQDSFLVSALHMAHKLISNRSAVFNSSKFKDFKASILRPATVDLATANGSCGSYSTVLARILLAGNAPVRFAQMKVNGVFGGHILVEGKSSGGWAVLDAMYDLYFVRPDGRLASFSDVKANWDYYKQQVPGDYDPDFRYSDVRYTNWEKIPVVLPLSKWTLDLVLGKEKADSISLRPYFLRIYHVAFMTGLVVLALVAFQMFRVIRMKHRARLDFSEQREELTMLKIPA